MYKDPSWTRPKNFFGAIKERHVEAKCHEVGSWAGQEMQGARIIGPYEVYFAPDELKSLSRRRRWIPRDTKTRIYLYPLRDYIFVVLIALKIRFMTNIASKLKENKKTIIFFEQQTIFK